MPEVAAKDVMGAAGRESSRRAESCQRELDSVTVKGSEKYVEPGQLIPVTLLLTSQVTGSFVLLPQQDESVDASGAREGLPR